MFGADLAVGTVYPLNPNPPNDPNLPNSVSLLHTYPICIVDRGLINHVFEIRLIAVISSKGVPNPIA